MWHTDTSTGSAVVGQDVIAGAAVECDKNLRVGGNLTGAGPLRAGHGIAVGGAIEGVSHIDAGWGIRAGAHIQASGAIKAGESLSAGDAICAGDGYGVFAGLNVQEESWDISGQVWAPQPPARLRSGRWIGPSVL